MSDYTALLDANVLYQTVNVTHEHTRQISNRPVFNHVSPSNPHALVFTEAHRWHPGVSG
jgi:hypothetical protein